MERHNTIEDHSTKKISLNIAGYEVLPVKTGTFALDGGAMFGTVPKVLWNRVIPSDDKNRIPMEARAMLLKGAEAGLPNILVDCGNGRDFVEKYGEKMGSKFADIYKIDQSKTTLETSLEGLGLGTEDIHHVILTHLHFDHSGGATCFKNGKVVPTFPKAKYHLQASNLETAKNPNRKEKASYFATNYEPLLEHHQLVLVDGDVENYLPGVSLWTSHGHTKGQQMVYVADNNKTENFSSVFYAADLIPTHGHIRLAWGMGYDLNPLLLSEEKEKYLTLLAKENCYLFFEHDPNYDVGTFTSLEFALKEGYRLGLSGSIG